MRRFLLLLAFLFFPLVAHAQVYPAPPSVGLLANRPVFCANLPQFYYATDVAGGTLYYATVAGTSCTWAAVSAGGGGGANTALSNLTAPTAINADLLPDTSGGRNLGSALLPWGTVYASTFDFNGPFISIFSTSLGPCATPSSPVVSAFCSTGPDGVPQFYDFVGGSWVDIANAISGLTTGQIPVAGSATTLTSSKALAGSGSGITTGPTSSTSGNVTDFTGTAGQIADSGVVAANLVVASSPGAGIAHFAGSTQTVTSSAVNLASDVTGQLPISGVGSAGLSGTSPITISSAGAIGCATCQVVPTLVQKQGSAGGDYTTSSSSATAVDNTNLSYTVSVPSGSKLSVVISGYMANNMLSDYAIVALGSGTCSTLLNAVALKAAVANNFTPFSLNWQVTGDGMSHTLLLCFNVTGGGTVDMSNGTGQVPVMDFRLEVAN